MRCSRETGRVDNLKHIGRGLIVWQNVSGILSPGEIVCPILPILCTKAPEKSPHFLVYPFHLSIGLGVIPWSETNRDSQFFQETAPELWSELGPLTLTISSGIPKYLKTWLNFIAANSNAEGKAGRGIWRRERENLSSTNRMITGTWYGSVRVNTLLKSQVIALTIQEAGRMVSGSDKGIASGCTQERASAFVFLDLGL